MGNCIETFSSPSPTNVKVLTFDGRTEEFPATTTVENIVSGPYQGYKLVHCSMPKVSLQPDAKLKAGQVYYLIPPVTQQHLKQPRSPKMGNVANGKRVKIVLSKQQLEMLFKNAKEFQLQAICVGTGSQKWRPSLATIPEF